MIYYDISKSMMAAREEGVGERTKRVKGGQIYGDRRRLDFGW